jgi:hypothetical protein
MIVKIKWQQVIVEGRHGIDQTKTWLHISIGSARLRDRRMAALLEQAMQIIHGLVAYMGAQELDEKDRRRIKTILAGDK